MNNLIAFWITDNRWIEWQIISNNRQEFFEKVLTYERDNWTTFVYPYAGTKKVTVKMDWDMVCATYEDFENLQESPAWFWKTAQEAITQLLKNDN